MAATAQELLIRIDASTELLRRELKQADTAVAQASTKMSRSLTQVDAAFGKLNLGAQRAASGVSRAMGVMGVAVGGAAIVQGIEGVISRMEEVERTAAVFDISADKVQQLGYAFRQFGLDSNDVSDALNTLADRAQDAIAGTQSMVDDFALIGISVDQLRGKKPDELFRLFADAVAHTDDVTQRNAAAVRNLGDDLGRKLLPLLLQGAAGLDRFADEAGRVGAVTDKEARANLAKAAKEFRKVKEIFTAQFTNAVAAQADSFTKLGETLSSDAFRRAMETAINLFGDLSEVVVTTLNAIGGVTTGFNTFVVQSQSLARAAGQKAGIDPSKKGIAQTIDDWVADQLGSSKPGAGVQGGGAVQTLPTVKVTVPRIKAAPVDLPVPDIYGPFTRVTPDDLVRAEDRLQAKFDELRMEEFGKSQAAVDLSNVIKFDLPMHGSESIAELEDQLDSLLAKGADMKQLGEDLGYAFSSSFEEAIISAQSLGGVLQGLVQDIQRILLRQFVTKPLANLIGTGISHMAGAPAASANGNVFDQQGLVPFARGGIVTQPAVFPFARGTGLMGEAGPEAILPLSRGRGGKLGVLSSGGGAPTIHLSQHIDARGAEPGVEQRLAAQAARIRNEAMAGVFEAIQRGGAAYDVVRAR